MRELELARCFCGGLWASQSKVVVGRVRGVCSSAVSFTARVSGGQPAMKPETVAARGAAEECLDEAVARG
jgi:hypothetical protein